jgi:hypothetical protein
MSVFLRNWYRRSTGTSQLIGVRISKRKNCYAIQKVRSPGTHRLFWISIFCLSFSCVWTRRSSSTSSAGSSSDVGASSKINGINSRSGSSQSGNARDYSDSKKPKATNFSAGILDRRGTGARQNRLDKNCNTYLSEIFLCRGGGFGHRILFHSYRSKGSRVKHDHGAGTLHAGFYTRQRNRPAPRPKISKGNSGQR